MLLTKGLEIEHYLGKKTGVLVPSSKKILEFAQVKDPKFAQVLSLEPEQRNIEFITEAHYSYFDLIKEACQKRIYLRDLIKKFDPDLTLVAGSSSSLGLEPEDFIISKSNDPYHKHIRDCHGLSTLTASIHYNFGLDNQAEVIRICNLLRLEAALILALSASSPFFNKQISGFQSYRWLSFPKNPEYIPFFKNQKEYINWLEKEIANKKLFNFRHLWSSVRPNGENRPYQIDRIEVRIADASFKWEIIRAILAWVEARIIYFLEHPEIDTNQENCQELNSICQINESDSSSRGLSASFSDWLFQEETSIFQAIENRLKELSKLNLDFQIKSNLKLIEKILMNGNESSQKLEKVNNYQTIENILQDWTREFVEEDLALFSSL